MKYYIIAGEASGDLHGSNLMKELMKRDRDAEFRFWGGDLMLKQADNIVRHYKELAFMGLLEVLQNLGKIISNIRFCKKDINNFKCRQRRLTYLKMLSCIFYAIIMKVIINTSNYYLFTFEIPT